MRESRACSKREREDGEREREKERKKTERGKSQPKGDPSTCVAHIPLAGTSAIELQIVHGLCHANVVGLIN